MPVISRERVSEISERFASLNPYDRRFVPESILKIERINDDSNGQPRALRGFAISAKRYALYERDGDDVRIDDDPIAALADKYRADSIGARTPVDSLRHWTERMLDDVDAVVVSLPPDDAVFGWDYPALRDVLQARDIPHVCLRGDSHEAPASVDHAALAAMVSTASRLQEARRG